MFRGFLGVMLGVQMMAIRYMRVMAGLFVIPRIVMVRRRAMVLRGVIVMFRCLAMMICALFGHSMPFRGPRQRGRNPVRAYPPVVTATSRLHE